MKRLFYILILLLITISVIAQNQILNEEDIPKLNSIIKSLEKEYGRDKLPVYNSIPQTSASYFIILTKEPNEFLSSLKNSKNLQQLLELYPNLRVEKDLLVIKNIYSNYKKEKKLEIKSFAIGNSFEHRIDLNFSDSLNKSDIKYFTKCYTRKKDNITTIYGFYLNKEFKSIPIPEKYADCIHYTDIVVKPETSIFFNKRKKSNNRYRFKKTIIDSLVKYYEIKTNRPLWDKDKTYVLYKKELEIWQSKKQRYSDSLYNKDEHFKNLLHDALLYAEENKVSNGDLEDFTAYLISKKRALNLMRQNQQMGTCSFDSRPVKQLKRIAKIAAQTQDWEVFIKSLLNVMNDYASRVAYSNIASQSRKTYIGELSKLDLDINKILIGTSWGISDTIHKHYFSDGSKIAKAYTNLDSEHQKYFEETVFDILSNKSIDAFNKLCFFNTYKYYKSFLKDSIKIRTVEDNIRNIIPLLPEEIKSGIENPNKPLYDLLYKEKEDLNKFEIKSSRIASIYSYSYHGECWRAKLVEKGSDGRIIYDLTMPIGEEIIPLKRFLDKKTELKSRVESHLFLQKILNENPENKLYIRFTKDKSFANFQNKVTKEIPPELASKLNFDDAISLYISFPRRKCVRFILLKNNNLLVLGIPKDFTLPGYSFEELMTKKEEEFLSTSYKSFKLFNEKGKMLNKK
jgi:hypothetical protein